MSYVAHVFTVGELKADPTKITAISKMPPLEDTTAVQCFPRMIIYLGKVIQNLSEVSTPIHPLLHKDVVWS